MLRPLLRPLLVTLVALAPALAAVPSRADSDGEKITMSPSRYFGRMLSPVTRAAKASLSRTSGQPT